MLFGESVTPDEAVRQLDLAHEAGVRFFDTAEMYPVPQRAETQVRVLCRLLHRTVLMYPVPQRAETQVGVLCRLLHCTVMYCAALMCTYLCTVLHCTVPLSGDVPRPAAGVNLAGPVDRGSGGCRVVCLAGPFEQGSSSVWLS